MSSKLAKNIVLISSIIFGCFSLLALIISGEFNVPVFIWGIIFICVGVLLLFHLKPKTMRIIMFFELGIYCFGIIVACILIFANDVLTGAIGILMFGIPFSFGIVHLINIRKENISI